MPVLVLSDGMNCLAGGGGGEGGHSSNIHIIFLIHTAHSTAHSDLRHLSSRLILYYFLMLLHLISMLMKVTDTAVSIS